MQYIVFLIYSIGIKVRRVFLQNRKSQALELGFFIALFLCTY